MLVEMNAQTLSALLQLKGENVRNMLIIESVPLRFESQDFFSQKARKKETRSHMWPQHCRFYVQESLISGNKGLAAALHCCVFTPNTTHEKY